MNIVEQEAVSLVQMSVGPMAKCINNSRASKRADLTQTHINMCWAIVKPIVEKITPERYRELIRDIEAYVSICLVGRNLTFMFSAQALLDDVRNQTRFPQSLNPSNWHKAQKAERQADRALRNARVS
jgi:hypothetical protein